MQPLQRSYTLIAPIYDLVVDRATRHARRASLAALGDVTGKRILIAGIGSGLDIPLLPQGADYVGLDVTPAMLRRARRYDRNVALHQGDVMAMPYADACFDAVVMHLILAVVPQPLRALREAARVVKPGGHIAVFDKFLRPGQRAPLRRLLSPFTGRLATRMDVVVEELLAACPDLKRINDEAALTGGWFRRILLEKVITEPDVITQQGSM